MELSIKSYVMVSTGQKILMACLIVGGFRVSKGRAETWKSPQEETEKPT